MKAKMDNFLKDIPEAFWLVLVGGALPLLSSWLTNRHSNKQLRIQNAHEGEEKNKQRLADLRQSVYLEAAEAMTKANAMLGKLAAIDMSKVNPGDEMAPFFASLMKVQMVGEVRTTELANKLASTYGELLGRLTIEAMPIQSNANTIARETERHDIAQAEIARLEIALNVHAESGMAESRQSKTVSDALLRNKDLVSKINQGLKTLNTERAVMLLKTLNSLAPTMAGVASEFLPLFVEIRSELDLHSDVEGFRRMFAQQASRVQAMADQVTAGVNRQMGM